MLLFDRCQLTMHGCPMQYQTRDACLGRRMAGVCCATQFCDVGHTSAIHASTLVDHEKIVKTLHRELWLKHKSLYRNLEMTLKSFNAWVIYRIKSIKLSMVTFILTLESVNEIWANFDFFLLLRCYNERQGRKLWQVWRQNTLRKQVKFAHKSTIYPQYFSLSSQCKACSFSFCNRMKHTFSCHRVSWTKSWNMSAKTENIYAWPDKIHQFVFTGNVVIYHLTGGGHKIFELTNYASHVSMFVGFGVKKTAAVTKSSLNRET